jgi:hypothetical protein
VAVRFLFFCSRVVKHAIQINLDNPDKEDNMSDEILKTLVVTLGPLVAYVTVLGVTQTPELVASLPATARHAIEAIGAMLIVAALLSIGTLGGALALIGILLLLTPITARYLTA